MTTDINLLEFQYLICGLKFLSWLLGLFKLCLLQIDHDVMENDKEARRLTDVDGGIGD